MLDNMTFNEIKEYLLAKGKEQGVTFELVVNVLDEEGDCEDVLYLEDIVTFELTITK